MKVKFAGTVIVVTLCLFPSVSAMTVDVTKSPEDGLYLEIATRQVYEYNASTGTLAPAFIDVETPANGAYQTGLCIYTGNGWEDPDAEYAYGRCASLRPLGNGAREFTWRFDAKLVNGPTMTYSIYNQFKNAVNAPIGSASLQLSAFCGSNVVQMCERLPRSLETMDDPVPVGATSYCIYGIVYEHVAGIKTEVLRVSPPCQAI